jgi:hypothetical protein
MGNKSVPAVCYPASLRNQESGVESLVFKIPFIAHPFRRWIGFKQTQDLRILGTQSCGHIREYVPISITISFRLNDGRIPSWLYTVDPDLRKC